MTVYAEQVSNLQSGLFCEHPGVACAMALNFGAQPLGIQKALP